MMAIIFRRVSKTLLAAVCALALGCGGRSPTSPSAVPTATPSPSPTPASDPAPSPSPSPPPGGSTAVRLGEDFTRQLFPADNWWNQDITGAPIDSQSDAFINFIGRTRAGHPDYGPPPYGIPYVGVGGTEPRTTVAF